MAIGAVLTASPRVLVLDEPTSALDPAAAEEVLASLTRLVHDLGLTVLLAEHRLERVLPFADSRGAGPGPGSPAGGRTGGRGHGRLAGGAAPGGARPPGRLGRRCPCRSATPAARPAPLRDRLAAVRARPARRRAGRRRPLARLGRVTVRYDDVTALDAVDLEVRGGRGRGRHGPERLRQVDAARPAGRGARPDVGHGATWTVPIPSASLRGPWSPGSASSPRTPALLLYGDSVAAECAGADHDTGPRPGTTAAMLERVLPGLPADRHPRDLSEGQRLALALAVVLAPAPPLLLLDEPTRGLDYPGKARLVRLLAELAADGHAVVMATHDVELVAQVATRAVVLAEGEVVADGPARDVVCHSPVFAPQVAKVLAPDPWLTVDEVRTALEAEPVRG